MPKWRSPVSWLLWWSNKIERISCKKRLNWLFFWCFILCIVSIELIISTTFCTIRAEMKNGSMNFKAEISSCFFWLEHIHSSTSSPTFLLSHKLILLLIIVKLPSKMIIRSILRSGSLEYLWLEVNNWILSHLMKALKILA